jgi:hypothetical protein
VVVSMVAAQQVMEFVDRLTAEGRDELL